MEVARALAEERGVVALGGGAPVQPGAAELLQGHTVVFLDVGIADASRRIGFDQSRPLLAVNPRASWVAMMNVRRAVYEAVATFRADTAGRTPGGRGGGDRGRPRRQPTRSGGGRVTGPLTSIPVGTGDDAHEVVVGHGVVDAVVPLLGEAVQRVLVVHPPTLAVWAQQVADSARAAGLDTYLAVVPDAEDAKSATVAAELWGALGQAGFTRTDAVVGVGGGTVTDLAGFVAATWLRGVRVVQVPTTLLAMVDAAVGGKTGINTPEGKNLVGSFHPPAGVLCDLDALATLPTPDLVAGMAEVVKCGFVADPRILELVEADPVAAVDVEGPFLRQLVERAIQVKADVVTADLREMELREILNYGHTFGHAIEQVEGYRWRHGEAVSVGMTYAARARPALRPPRAGPRRPAPGDPHQPRPAGHLRAGPVGGPAHRHGAATRRPAGRGCGSSSSTTWRYRSGWKVRPTRCCARRTAACPADRLTRAAQEPQRRRMAAARTLHP